MCASDYRRIARDRLTDNWWLSVGITAVACLLGGLMAGSNFLPDLNINLEQKDLNFLALGNTSIRLTLGNISLLSRPQFILGGTIQLGYCRYLLAQCDKQELRFNDLFSEFDRFGIGFAQHFLRSLYSFLWGLLFIIPGIIASYSYAMTPYILAENPDMSASDAIEQSKYMMDGYKWELFCLHFSFIGWDLLCILTLNLGHLALNPYKNAADAVFYRNLQQDLRKRHEAGYV